MKKIVALMGFGLGVVGCFGQVADGGGSKGNTPTPAPASSSDTVLGPDQGPAPSPPTPVPPQATTVDAGDGGTITPCVSDSGTTCNRPDGAECAGNQECASGVCYGDTINGGHCSELCTAANAATVCNFGRHQCGESGMCLIACTGGTCLADGQACNGDLDCASDICFANGSASGGACSEYCNAANEAKVCTFGQHKCSDPNNGICL